MLYWRCIDIKVSGYVSWCIKWDSNFKVIVKMLIYTFIVSLISATNDQHALEKSINVFNYKLLSKFEIFIAL